MADNFDPNDPNEEGGKSQYLTKKDALVIGIGLVCFFLLLIPVYNKLKNQRNEVICKQNLKAISSALQQYMVSNDDSLPPIYTRLSDGTPYEEKGKVITWVTLVRDYMPDRSTFVCPSAEDDEKVANINTTGDAALFSTYGFYAPFDAYPRNLVPNPGEIALIAETSNHGAKGTYNPFPIKSDKKESQWDGFLIGYDNNNTKFDAGKQITRLAVYDNTEGTYKADKIARHGEGIYTLSLEGNIKLRKVIDLGLTKLAGDPQGLWTVPVAVKRTGR